MMNAIWKSNLGKLFLGSCGTQLGAVFALATLAGVFLVCSVCAASSALTAALAQPGVVLPANATVEALPIQEAGIAPTSEAESLRAEITSLVGQVESLKAKAASQPAVSTPVPVQPKPFAIALQPGVNLRSGPGASYYRVGTLPLGTRVEIMGRNQDSSWWLVAAPEGLAWVSANYVTAYDVGDKLPMVSIPALLVWPTPLPGQLAPIAAQPASSAGSLPSASAQPPFGTPSASTSLVPCGTPTATAAQGGVFVEDTEGFKQLRKKLSYPPIAASFSPQGNRIALTEGIKLYLITTDSFNGQILMSENGIIKPAGNIVWSPDGQYLAVVVEKLNCTTCRSVVLVRISDDTLFFLQTPNNLTGDEPRWTQDGRLLINVYPNDPAQGTAYVYDLEGKGQVAAGTFALSSSHEGQKWFPWRPGRIWQAGVTERPDAYNAD
jgi:hypothetical protein